MSNIFGGDEVNALVLDVGTYTCKAGYAGDDAPKAVFPSHVGVVGGAKDTSRMDVDGAAPQGRQLHFGQSGVNFRRDNMEVVSPFGTMDETVEDWDMVEGLWQHAFKDRLRADPTEYAILMAESNLAPKAVREKAVELLFERFKVPAVYLAKSAALSAFATARQTGLVVDAGYRSTSVAVVHDGFVLTKSAVNIPVGGKLLSHLTQRAMEAKAIKMLPRYLFKRKEIAAGEFKIEELSFPNTTPSFHAYQLEQLVTDIREAVCKVHETPFEENIHQHLPASIYELPDGTEISVGSDRLKVPEVFFQPQLLSTFTGFSTDILKKADGTTATVPSLPAAVLDSINKCDVDVRRDLYQGVVLTGGVSLTSGLRDRLEKELQDQGPQAGRFKVITAANAMERKFSVWIGGSILASLGSFQQMWMSKKEYEEHGAALIHRKAP